MKNNPLLWKLLRSHISKVQLVGFGIANLLGLFIVLVGLQFYSDIRSFFTEEDGFFNKDYLVVTKSVGNINMVASLVGGADVNAFSDDDIAELKEQPWLKKVGCFTTAGYRVQATVSLAGQGLRSDIFFESVPDEFLDIEGGEWVFDEKKPEIPILVSKDYLSLYNFGFAASRGMPQLSESMIKKVPIILCCIASDGRREYLPARIVGFSGRISSILVPDSFMKWSNERYAAEVERQPSRLVLEVVNPGDPKIETFMKEHHYEVGGDKMNSNKTSYLINVLMVIVASVGLLISLLSFFILILSIYLLLQKNVDKLRNLLLLGYTPKEVAATYIRMVVGINATVCVVALGLLVYVRMLYLPVLESLSIDCGTILPSLLAAVVVIGAITAGNVVAIRKKVTSLWLLEK